MNRPLIAAFMLHRSPDAAGSSLTASDVQTAPQGVGPDQGVQHAPNSGDDDEEDKLLNVATSIVQAGGKASISKIRPTSGSDRVVDAVVEQLEGILIIPSFVGVIKLRPRMNSQTGKMEDTYGFRTNFVVGTVGEIDGGSGRNAGALGRDFISSKELSRTHQCVRYHAEMPFFAGQTPSPNGLFTSTRVNTRTVLAPRMDSDDASNKVKIILSRYKKSIDALWAAAGIKQEEDSDPSLLLEQRVASKLAALSARGQAQTPAGAGAGSNQGTEALEHGGLTTEEAEELLELKEKSSPSAGDKKRIKELEQRVQAEG